MVHWGHGIKRTIQNQILGGEPTPINRKSAFAGRSSVNPALSPWPDATLSSIRGNPGAHTLPAEEPQLLDCGCFDKPTRERGIRVVPRQRVGLPFSQTPPIHKVIRPAGVFEFLSKLLI